MQMLWRRIRGLASDRQGVTALEYGLIGGIMGIAVVAAFTAVWSPMSPAFTLIGNFLVNTAASGF
jgi:pilus assembly protein Flp/PilA